MSIDKNSIYEIGRWINNIKGILKKESEIVNIHTKYNCWWFFHPDFYYGKNDFFPFVEEIYYSIINENKIKKSIFDEILKIRNETPFFDLLKNMSKYFEEKWIYSTFQKDEYFYKLNWYLYNFFDILDSVVLEIENIKKFKTVDENKYFYLLEWYYNNINKWIYLDEDSWDVFYNWDILWNIKLTNKEWKLFKLLYDKKWKNVFHNEIVLLLRSEKLVKEKRPKEMSEYCKGVKKKIPDKIKKFIDDGIWFYKLLDTKMTPKKHR